MKKNSLWTIVGVIIAVVVAWWLVSALFSLLWFVVKLVIVAVVAVGVYFLLRNLLRSDES